MLLSFQINWEAFKLILSLSKDSKAFTKKLLIQKIKAMRLRETKLKTWKLTKKKNIMYHFK